MECYMRSMLQSQKPASSRAGQMSTFSLLGETFRYAQIVQTIYES